MLASGPGLSPETRRTLFIAFATSALTSLATGLVSWGIEAAKGRAKPPAPPQEEGCWGCTLTAPAPCPKHQGDKR